MALTASVDRSLACHTHLAEGEWRYERGEERSSCEQKVGQSSLASATYTYRYEQFDGGVVVIVML